MKHNKQKGVFIPIGILENSEFSPIEKVIFSIYTYYTENGKGCYYSANKLAKMLNVGEKTIDRAKKHLRDLGLIVTKKVGKYSVTSTIIQGQNDPANTLFNEGQNDPTNKTVEEVVIEEVTSENNIESFPVCDRVKMTPIEGQNDPVKEGQNDPAINKDTLNKEIKKEYILKGDNTMKNNRLENYVSDTSEGEGFNIDRYNTFSNWKDRIEYCVSVPVLVPSQDRKEARSWVFRKWQSYLQAITAGDLSWGVTFQYLPSFLNWLKVTSNDLEWYRAKRGELRSQFRHAALKRFFNGYGEMIEGAKTEYIHRPADYSTAYNSNIETLKHIYSLGGETREGEREDALTKARVMWEQVTVPQLEKVKVADPDEDNRSNGGGLVILSTITGRPAPATPKPSMVRSDYGDLPFCD